jgi:hypothetical protein
MDNMTVKGLSNGEMVIFMKDTIVKAWETVLENLQKARMNMKVNGLVGNLIIINNF